MLPAEASCPHSLNAPRSLNAPHDNLVPELSTMIGVKHLAAGTLNTARSFSHESRLNDKADLRYDRRRRRTSLPTVCETSEGMHQGGLHQECIGGAPVHISMGPGVLKPVP